MKIKEIKITGEIVGNSVTISCREGKPLLVMTYTSSGVSGKMDADNDGHTARWVAAKYIQEFLDGYEGTQTDVREYLTLLEMMMD